MAVGENLAFAIEGEGSSGSCGSRLHGERNQRIIALDPLGVGFDCSLVTTNIEGVLEVSCGWFHVYARVKTPTGSASLKSSKAH
ncbi:hypothetical protein Droror1_Dr00026984 [Drosera rotundifolia]